MPLPALLCDLKERVPVDGHAVTLRLSWLPITALRLHPAERGLLQLVPGHDLSRQNQSKHHGSMKNSYNFFPYYPSNQLLLFTLTPPPPKSFPSLFPEHTGYTGMTKIRAE